MADILMQGPQRATRASFSFSRVLDGLSYTFRFAYNSRMQQWFIDVSGSDGTTLILGLRAATGHNLIRPFVDDRLPPGQIFILDGSGNDRDPGRLGWREDFQFVYRPAADVLAAAGTSAEVD